MSLKVWKSVLLSAVAVTTTSCGGQSGHQSEPTFAPPSTSSPGTTPAFTPEPTPTSRLRYLGKVSVRTDDGDEVEVALDAGAMSVGQVDALPAEAVSSCISGVANISRALYVAGRATVTLKSSLATSVRVTIKSSFEPVLYGLTGYAIHNSGGGWDCGSDLFTFARQMTAGESRPFDFVLIAPGVLTPESPRPDDNLLNAWTVNTGILLTGGLHAKHRISGPYAANCNSEPGADRLAIVRQPPFTLRFNSKNMFGQGEENARMRCAPVK